MIRSYLPALVFLGLGAILGLIFATINSFLGRFLGGGRRPRRSQGDPYECGLPSDVKKDFRFGISFYLVAMLFILFDIETILLYPVALQLDAFGIFALLETIVFIVLLLIAYVYVWRRGALEWR
ncbi:MAG TPA: NADH-quinone oxidoreductase subunit A [Solirubrobacteraceae bacterium]|jgi:NADH-quinone oxidoreductase subunit A|nr:NADH-quinone oxidoreductase subunit A [Solirubrobacteraceae bacterium]